MIHITHTNGVKSQYDETFKSGDLITAYQKGYHEFVSYTDRGPNMTPLVHYRKRFNFNGKPCNSKKIISCDAAYCRRATDHIQSSIEQKDNEIDLLTQVLAKAAVTQLS
jgi:hypothetical protein